MKGRISSDRSTNHDPTLDRYFRDTGFSVDIEALRTEHPGLLDLDSWLQLQRDARDANDVPLV